MEKNKYKQIVKKYTPKENRLFNGLIAFGVGGIMGVIGELLLELYAYLFDIPTKEAGTFMIITLIAVGALLTCFGFFDKMVNFCKAGLLIPITGFANSIVSPAMEFKREGYVLGVGANMFKIAGPVLVYGIGSSILFGFVYYIVKMFI